MRIGMIGTGYVGLVSGACFADFGHVVTCVDHDEKKIALLRDDKVPVYEPGLSELIAKNTAEERLFFSSRTQDAVRDADAVFIAVGTPSRRGDGHADLSYVRSAATEIIDLIDHFTVIVTKSTVPVGTGDELESIMRARRPEADFSVVSNPEFLREGAAIKDFKIPDRIVVGTEDDRAREVMREIYRPLFLNETPVLFTSRKNSEMIKYASNAFLATKISFINEIADVCEVLGANVQEISRGIGLDNRIGPKFLNAGPGYGGSCFPKDTVALARTARDHGVPLRILDAVIETNNCRKKTMVNRILDVLGEQPQGKTVALLGLAFKPNTDDMREAPSLEIIPALQRAGVGMRAFDPKAMDEAGRLLDGVTFAANPYECVDSTDVMVIVTEWDQFRALDLDRVRRLMAHPVIVDLRNIYAPAEMAAKGFVYSSVGRVGSPAKIPTAN